MANALIACLRNPDANRIDALQRRIEAGEGAPEGEATEPVAAPEPPPPPPSQTIKGVLKIDKDRALAVELVVPYDHPDAKSRSDEVTIAPIRVGDPK